MDRYLAQLDALGATVVVTADHGMNAKTDAFGRPEHRVPAGRARPRVRRRHDARDPADHRPLRRPSRRARLVRDGLPVVARRRSPTPRARIAALPGIELVLPRAEACARFELPADRVGDLVVVSERLTVIGTSRDRHDLSGLDAPLRSHGGVSEQQVPLIANRRGDRAARGPPLAQLRRVRPRAQPPAMTDAAP